MRRVKALPRVLVIYAAAVLLDYAGQVVYAADLYGLRVNPAGVALLGATFVWFLVGFWAVASGRRFGWPLLTAYALAQVLFYAHGQLLLAFYGYGAIYELTHARDAIVLTVFLIGDLDFLAAIAALTYLLLRRPSALRLWP